jgi:hypothetical protein
MTLDLPCVNRQTYPDMNLRVKKGDYIYPDRKDRGFNQKEKIMDLPFVNGQRIFPERKNSGFNLRVKKADLP